MTENYREETLNKLFDDTRKALMEARTGSINNDELKKVERNEKNSWKTVNTLTLAKSIVLFLRDIMAKIQITQMPSGNITSSDFKKYYNYGELRNVEVKPKDDNDHLFSFLEDAEFEWKDEINYDTPNTYRITPNELSVFLNFSNSTCDVTGSAYHDGGYLECDDIDEDLLVSTLEEDGIYAKLHKQFGLDTSRFQTIQTIVLEIRYRRDYENHKTK